MKLLHNYYNTINQNNQNQNNQNQNNKTQNNQTSIQTTYKLEIPLEDFYNFSEQQFKIPILTKCYVCTNHYNSLCKICKGTIYYISIKLFTLKLHKSKYLIQKSGNHMMGFESPGDLNIHLVDKKHPYFKRTGNFNLVYVEYIDVQNITKNGDYELIFTFLDQKQYSLIINYQETIINHKKTIIQIENFGLPDYQGNYGNLFIAFKKQCQNNIINNNLLQNKKKRNKNKIINFTIFNF